MDLAEVARRRLTATAALMLDGHSAVGHWRYIAGYTGAFWPRETGIPVADADVVMDLAVAIAGR